MMRCTKTLPYKIATLPLFFFLDSLKFEVKKNQSYALLVCTHGVIIQIINLKFYIKLYLFLTVISIQTFN